MRCLHSWGGFWSRNAYLLLPGTPCRRMSICREACKCGKPSQLAPQNPEPCHAQYSYTNGKSLTGTAERNNRPCDPILRGSFFMVCMPACTPIALFALSGGPSLRKLPCFSHSPLAPSLRGSYILAITPAASRAASLPPQRPGETTHSSRCLQTEALLGPINHPGMGPVASVLGKIGRLASAIR